MKRILSQYEKLSGQAVNFGKSSIVFSPNTTIPDRAEVCQVLQVNEVHEPGKYLDMPMNVGRKKASVFHFLTDKVKKKLQSWGTKAISKAGIEVQMNSFWWRHGQNNRGLRWKTWGKLCVMKEAGGLGFKELRKFNISMLAKQGWRLLNNDNPLVTMCMKAKYFPNGDFLTARLGPNPSYMWRSQEVVIKRCRKRIGDGNQTEIWKVPWLPCAENGFMTTEMPIQLKGSKVCSFMQINQKKWGEDVLNDICNERDRNLIKRIPLTARVDRDTWFWLPDEKGCFTVKSWYRLLQGEIDAPYAKFWRKLWNLKLPGKIFHFLWRVCSLCLPTTLRLASKRVQVDTICQWCRMYQETDIHTLFECQIAAAVWVEVGLQGSINILPEDSVFDIFCRAFDRCSREQCTLLALVSWSIWNRRNKWIWEKVNMSTFGIKAAAFNLLAEWKKAQEQQDMIPTARGVSVVVRRWEKPQTSWVKINIDAALFEDINCIGLGSVVRGADGQFIMARSRRQDVLIPPKEAEAVSLMEALLWLKNKGFQRCVFETDSQVLVRACKEGDGRSFFHTIVRDCIDLFQHFDEVLVCFVSRSANRVAHELVKVAYSGVAC